jgi:hypothetical protein
MRPNPDLNANRPQNWARPRVFVRMVFDSADGIFPPRFDVIFWSSQQFNNNSMSEPQDDNSAPVNADNLQLSDFGIDNNGVINTFQGVDLKFLQAKQLRAIASKLKIKGIRNAKKESIVEAIIATVGAKKAYESLDLLRDNKESPDKARKTIHCSFRLMNILFSDKFCEELAQLGNMASRATLDTGKAGNDCHFWEKVQVEYQVDDNPLYNTLQFTDVDVFEAQEDLIDPSKILAHDWKKLRTIWKGLAADYKAALSRYTLSGTHESEFYNFCNGKIEPYYLRKLLELKPDVVGFVEADLPREAFMDTSSALFDGSSSNSNSEVNSSETKRRKTSGSELAEAIRDATNSRMQSELSKQRLFVLQQEQERRMKAISSQIHILTRSHVNIPFSNAKVV